MNTKLYVDNLGLATTESEMIALFSAYGEVVDTIIVVDHTSHKPRGFGFVTMVTAEGARAAIQGLNGKQMDADTLIVSEAWPAEDQVSSGPGRPGPRRRSSQLF